MDHPLVDELLQEDDLSSAFLSEDADYDDVDHVALIYAEPIAALHPRVPLCLPSSASLAAAIQLMKAKGQGVVLVVDDGTLKGIFTERDVLNRIVGEPLDLEKEKLADYMTKDPETLTMQDKIAFVLNRMTMGGYRRVPIVDAQGKPCGLVSVKEVIQYIVSQTPGDVYNMRPTPMIRGFPRPEGE